MDNNSKNCNCVICNAPLSANKIVRGVKTCSRSCAAKLSWKTYCLSGSTKHSDHLRNLWKQEDFRKKKTDYMKTNNPVYKDGVVQKSNATKEQNGILHTWMGVRGGNGKISECEQLIYDFCIQHGFEYNKAINTYSIRKQYPDKHYGFNYKPDFTNSEYKLCVEVDGKAHYTTDGRLVDSKKEFCLNALGYTVIRFTNDEVKQNVELVETIILNKLKELGWSCG